MGISSSCSSPVPGVRDVLLDPREEDDSASPVALGHASGSPHHLATCLLPLQIRAPPPAPKTLLARMEFKQKGIDTRIGALGRHVGWSPRVSCGNPRLAPRKDVPFQGCNDLGRDLLAKFGLAGHRNLLCRRGFRFSFGCPFPPGRLSRAAHRLGPGRGRPDLAVDQSGGGPGNHFRPSS